jgi:RNA polymerase sigma factor (sigma-70 family)
LVLASFSIIFSDFDPFPIASTQPDITSEPLVGRLKNRDRAALETLYDKYSGALYGAIIRIIKQEDLADEILQDTFLRIWDKIDSYDAAKGRLFTWMLNIARNLAIDKTRSKEISQQSKTGDLENFVGTYDRQESGVLPVDTIGLTETLNRLPQEQRFVVDHLYLKGYTQSELAEESGIPLGTIKTRLRLGMLELRKLYQVT